MVIDVEFFRDHFYEYNTGQTLEYFFDEYVWRRIDGMDQTCQFEKIFEFEEYYSNCFNFCQKATAIRQRFDRTNRNGERVFCQILSSPQNNGKPQCIVELTKRYGSSIPELNPNGRIVQCSGYTTNYQLEFSMTSSWPPHRPRERYDIVRLAIHRISYRPHIHN